jgi:GT2 family glycosyltransferase
LASVSVVVLNFNRKDELRETLRDVLAQTHRPLEVIAVDNASKDGSAAMVRDEFPSVKLVELKENVGIHGRRRGLEAAAGDIVMMYDDDSGPSKPDDLARVAEFFDRRKEISAVCTAVWRTRSSYSETWGWEDYAVSGNEKDGYEGLYVHGSGTAYRRTDLLKTGAFDETLFWGDEELDAALDLASRGLRIVYYPLVVTNHRASLVNRNKARYYRLVVRNHILIFGRYFRGSEAFSLTMKEIFYQSALARLSFPHVWAGAWDAFLRRGESKGRYRPIPENMRPYLREMRGRRYPGPVKWFQNQLALKKNRGVKVFS